MCCDGVWIDLRFLLGMSFWPLFSSLRLPLFCCRFNGFGAFCCWVCLVLCLSWSFARGKTVPEAACLICVCFVGLLILFKDKMVFVYLF